MSRKAIAALGIGQCVNWGVLYYSFTVLVLPLQRELGVDIRIVTGAFSLALLMSAALAPTVGRWTDRGHGPSLMSAGTALAAALLAIWALWPSVAMLYVCWVGLGCCMAATLYEPAFAIVGRAIPDSTARLRGLAIVTLFGGVASTIFLPVTAVLVDTLGWQAAVLMLSATLLVAAGLTHAVAFRHLAPAVAEGRALESIARRPVTSPLQFGLIAVTFASASLASAGFTSNLVPAFGERSIPPTTAAMLGGLLGVMQLPGRALLMRGTLVDSPTRLLVITLLLQALGLGVLAMGPSVGVVAAGTVVFALGAGLITLVRPHLIYILFGRDGSGGVNGRIASHQQLARAIGPIAIASLAGISSYAIVFATISGMFALFALAAATILGTTAFPLEQESV